jgi:hypothetical protein
MLGGAGIRRDLAMFDPAHLTPEPVGRHSGARALAREPGIHNHGRGVWIPGSRALLARAPRNDGN